MRSKLLIPIFCFLFASAGLQGQNLHFSLWDFSPSYLNPATTGAFLGTYRIGGIVRQQWSSPLRGKAFNTASMYVDSPIIRGIRKQDWIGVGLGFDYDVAGTGNFTTTLGRIGAAYHLALDKKQKNIFTVGFQMGSTSRKLNLQDFVDRYALLNNTADPSFSDSPELLALSMNTDENGDLSNSFRDYIIGIGYRSKLSKTSDLSLGLSVSQLFKPNASLGVGIDELPTKITIHGQMSTMMSKRLKFTPAVIIQKQGPAWDRGISGTFGYLLQPKTGLVLNGGLGMRVVNATALQLLLGAEWKSFRFGASYDAQIVGAIAEAGNTVGGFELAVSYIGKIYKKPKVKPLIICPRL